MQTKHLIFLLALTGCQVATGPAEPKASPSPTASPVASPTASPSPIASPTPVPTLSPTPAPTPKPTSESLLYPDRSCMGLTLDSFPPEVDGWTVLPDLGRKIYVSKANDPAKSKEPVFYVKTASEGQKFLRKGQPDQLLFNRGEVHDVSDGIASPNIGGKSSKELMVFSAYGAGSRPVLQFTKETGLINSNQMIRNVAITNIDMQAIRVANKPYGVRIPGGIENMLIENVRMQNFHNAISIEVGDSKNLVIRRSAILDSYAMKDADGHSQGAYLDHVSGVLIEDNVFDHNGWKTRGAEPGRATQYNHNIYLMSTTKCVSVRNNTFSNGSATGIQIRSGGVFEKNVMYNNPMNTTYGLVNGGSVFLMKIMPGISGRYTDNVSVMGTDLGPTEKRYGSSEFSNMDGVLVARNIFAHHSRGLTDSIGMVFKGTMGVGIHNVRVENNIVYDVKTGFVQEGQAFGPVNLRLETNEDCKETPARTATGAAVWNATTKLYGPCKSGIHQSYAGKVILDTGAALTGNISQQGLKDFQNLASLTKFKAEKLQTAPVVFKDPNRLPTAEWLSKARNQAKGNWIDLNSQMRLYIQEGFTH